MLFQTHLFRTITSGFQTWYRSGKKRYTPGIFEFHTPCGTTTLYARHRQSLEVIVSETSSLKQWKQMTSICSKLVFCNNPLKELTLYFYLQTESNFEAPLLFPRPLINALIWVALIYDPEKTTRISNIIQLIKRARKISIIFGVAFGVEKIVKVDWKAVILSCIHVVKQ